jgi:hypothetical protein
MLICINFSKKSTGNISQFLFGCTFIELVTWRLQSILYSVHLLDPSKWICQFLETVRSHTRRAWGYHAFFFSDKVLGSKINYDYYVGHCPLSGISYLHIYYRTSLVLKRLRSQPSPLIWKSNNKSVSIGVMTTSHLKTGAEPTFETLCV